MILGVLSDIHDGLQNLAKALQILSEKGAEELIFCGDFCAPFAAKMLAESQLPVHCVFGNNDGDRFAIQKVTAGFEKFIIYGEYIGDGDSLLQLGGAKIGVTHYPFYAKTMAKTGWYDAVFYGHNHMADKQKFGNCLLMNPGEVGGILNPPSLGLFDTQLRSSEIVWL